MIDLNILKDASLNSLEHKTLESEIEIYSSILEELEDKEKISMCLNELLKNILEESPEKESSNWFMEDNKWVVKGVYGKKVNYYKKVVNHALYEKILNLLGEIGIDATLSKEKIYASDSYIYVYKYKISFDDYNIIKEYLINLESRMDKDIKHKLFEQEINSWPEWKKKYHDKNLVKDTSKKLTSKHN